MAKKSKSKPKGQDNTTAGSIYFATVDSNGVAPDSRIPSSNDAFAVAWQMLLDNQGREQKWSRIYKCYKRFAPNEYSIAVRKNLVTNSNVNFGQMEFIVDNQKSSFYDMVTERTLASQIITKKGNEKDKRIWSDLISIGFDAALRKWASYLPGVEQDLEEMLLYGKGFELAEDRDGWPTKSFHNSDILIPDRTFADLSNLGELVIKRSYTPLEFWKKVTGGEKDSEKAEAHARDLGWNFWACVDAMRMWTTNFRNTITPTQWLRDVASGNFNLSRFYNLRIEIFELYVEEFDGSISKCQVLQNYGNIVDGYRSDKERPFKDLTEEDYRQKTGFIYYRKNWVERIPGAAAGEVWKEIICPFTDNIGSGLWHETKGLAERIFVQCRQYDINMNRVVDAMNLQMMLLVKGGSADATQKLKRMEWGPWAVIPEDIDPIQIQMKLPFQEVLSGITYYQSDLYRGIGAYRINAPTNGGKQRTRGEAELDAAESAFLQGTQVKRYNSCHTWWQRMLYKRMMNTKSGGFGYQIAEEFREFLLKNGVPEEAWAPENIESIESNMLNGAGSASFKLMAAEKTLAILQVQPATTGEFYAKQDAIAALQGRQNVRRYLPERPPMEMNNEVRVIGFENAGMDDALGNIENFRVEPTDNHVEHFKGHWSDAMITCDKAEMLLQGGSTDGQTLNDIVQSIMRLKGPHMVAHLQFLSRDKGKENILKTFEENLQVLQRRTDQLASIAQEMLQAQQPQGEGKSEEDLKLEFQAAQNALKLKYEQDRMNIKTSGAALSHQQKDQQRKEQAATTLATQRATADNQNRIMQENAALQRQIEAEKAAQEKKAKATETSEE